MKKTKISGNLSDNGSNEIPGWLDPGKQSIVDSSQQDLQLSPFEERNCICQLEANKILLDNKLFIRNMPSSFFQILFNTMAM